MSSFSLDKTLWTQKKHLSLLKYIFPKQIIHYKIKKNDITVIILKSALPAILLFLKQNQTCQYKQLIDIAASDFPTKTLRFTLNYLLLCSHFNTRLVVRTKIDELSAIVSAKEIFNSADWLEREVWDLFGIFFQNHTDLRRILTDYGFKGHPLRKEFPLSGFIEVYYNDEEKRIVYEDIELAQEYRSFNLQNPWKK